MNKLTASLFSTLLCTALSAQGSFAWSVPGLGAWAVGIGFDSQGGRQVTVNCVVQPDYDWHVVDADGDGQQDDIRVTNGSGDQIDMINAAAATPTGGSLVMPPHGAVGSWQSLDTEVPIGC